MFKIQGIFLAIMVVFQGMGSIHASVQDNPLQQQLEYRWVKRDRSQGWAKKAFKTIGYGAAVGLSVGAMCAGLDIRSPWYHMPLHWGAAYFIRHVAVDMVKENCDDEGKPCNNKLLDTTSWLSSWGSWLGIMYMKHYQYIHGPMTIK